MTKKQMVQQTKDWDTYRAMVRGADLAFGALGHKDDKAAYQKLLDSPFHRRLQEIAVLLNERGRGKKWEDVKFPEYTDFFGTLEG